MSDSVGLVWYTQGRLREKERNSSLSKKFRACGLVMRSILYIWAGCRCNFSPSTGGKKFGVPGWFLRVEIIGNFCLPSAQMPAGAGRSRVEMVHIISHTRHVCHPAPSTSFHFFSDLMLPSF
jgi:hypothetical protein